jgi:orotidine-5'-phosphate decarboxylase
MKLSPLIVALDVDSMKQVEMLVRRLGPAADFYKVGLRLYTRYGPEAVRFLKAKRKKVFLDLKFHDIPNTVAEACREATRLKVQMLTLHASGGGAMMHAAAAAVRLEARRLRIERPLLMGVTVLTSLNSLGEVGVSRSPRNQVLRLAGLASRSGLDGVICSPMEASVLRQSMPRGFRIVTPGVRPPGSAKMDQKRVKTPEAAFAAGADAVVVGRPILQAKDPLGVVRQILQVSSK